MKPVSLKLPTEPDDMPSVADYPRKDRGPRYPWGTRLELDLKTLKKMGLKIEDFSVGNELEICGMVEVTSISQNADTDGGARGQVTLQVKTLGFESGDDKEKLSKKLRALLKKSRGESNDDGGEGEGDD